MLSDLLFVEGTMNVLKHHGVLAGPLGRTGKDVGVFIGNSALPILATQGGLVEHLVKLNDKVEAGQKVAIQRNSFGEVVAEYTSSVAGEVTGQRSDAMSEHGNPLAFILFHKATPDGGETYPSDSTLSWYKGMRDLVLTFGASHDIFIRSKRACLRGDLWLA